MTLDLKVQTRVKVSKPGSQTRVVTETRVITFPNQGQTRVKTRVLRFMTLVWWGETRVKTRVLRFMTLVWKVETRVKPGS